MNMKAIALYKIDDLMAEITHEKAMAENSFEVRSTCQWMEKQLSELRKLVQLIEELIEEN